MCEHKYGESKEKKVLYISYAFPPGGGSAVQRPLKFVKFLSEFGWKAHVISVNKNNYLFEALSREQIESLASQVTVCDFCEGGIIVKEGDIVLLAAFGSGFTWGSVLMRW